MNVVRVNQLAERNTIVVSIDDQQDEQADDGDRHNEDSKATRILGPERKAQCRGNSRGMHDIKRYHQDDNGDHRGSGRNIPSTECEKCSSS